MTFLELRLGSDCNVIEEKESYCYIKYLYYIKDNLQFTENQPVKVY